MMTVARNQFDLLKGLRLVIALALLNGLLSVVAVWPTLWVVPDWRISPEWSFVVLALVVLAVMGIRLNTTVLKLWAGAYCLLAVAHYADVVVPHLLGRPVNLYWDLPQIPRFVWVTVKGSPWWFSVAVLGAVTLGMTLFFKVVHWAWRTVHVACSQRVFRRGLLALALPCAALSVWHAQGTDWTWQVVAKPVVPTYSKEFVKLWDAWSEERANQLLPAQTPIDVALAMPKGEVFAALKQRNVMLMYLETYGAMLYDQPEAVNAVGETRAAWQRAIEQSGRGVVSAFYTSPTFGGASDLAHMSVLSGIDLSNPRKHDVLITTQRPTLLKLFQREGYEVVGLYHSVFWDWVERSYYGFDRYISGPDLEYRGPALGYWKIPDQFAIAKYEAAYAQKPGDAPRLTLFSTISTHFPFYQVPPYQPDWAKVLSPEPFDSELAAKAQAETVSWSNMRPDYFRSVNYCHQWLAGYFQNTQSKDTVYVLIGDHQPTGSVTGPDTPWDVPVYVISNDSKLLQRFEQLGFSKGLTPQQRQPLGGLHDIPSTLFRALGSEAVQAQFGKRPHLQSAQHAER